jgi:hypothetical protein
MYTTEILHSLGVGIRKNTRTLRPFMFHYASVLALLGLLSEAAAGEKQ